MEGIAPKLTGMAKRRGRNYTTPEDIDKAMRDKRNDPMDIAREVLAVLGKVAEIGAEDVDLCAFTAWHQLWHTRKGGK